MRSVSRFDRRRRGLLVALASVLVIAGLVLATMAPAEPSASNRADAYGSAPTNPKSRTECDKFYGGAANQTSTVRGCRALATYNIARKACAKKKRAKRASCTKAAKRALAKAKAKVAKQAAAEKACNDAQTAAITAINQQMAALDPNSPDYDVQAAALNAQLAAANAQDIACVKKAQSG